MPDYIDIIEKELGYKASQIKIIFELTDEGSTVPFIARYRKEATGNLDEKDIRSILELKTKEENLQKAKQTAVNGIEEQGKLTDDLLASILNAKTLKEVEDIYKPYKLKKKTKAMIAEEKGFRVVADMIRANNEPEIPAKLLEEYKEEEIIE
ncbi:MAG: Tex-like N-terminal domain-containing protein [Patescibacteria group bacterium]|nr:Tex-like N-terminal domain-containing protein [Patescibacteria group bacterium]